MLSLLLLASLLPLCFAHAGDPAGDPTCSSPLQFHLNGGKESEVDYDFELIQSVSGRKGHVRKLHGIRQVLHDEEEQDQDEEEGQFAVLRGSMRLSVLCSSGAEVGASSQMIAVRWANVTLDCDEALAPDRTVAECEERWIPIRDGLLANRPIWLRRDSSGAVHTKSMIYHPHDFAALRTMKGSMVKELLDLPRLCSSPPNPNPNASAKTASDGLASAAAASAAAASVAAAHTRCDATRWLVLPPLRHSRIHWTDREMRVKQLDLPVPVWLLPHPHPRPPTLRTLHP